ncbi:DUF4303 domain-containing protein [Kytococcus sp. Marseille-QA3725]
MGEHEDRATIEYLDGWSRRFAESLASRLAGAEAELAGQSLYVLALTTADMNLGPMPVLCTEEHLATLEFDRNDTERCRHHRWWPDEWGWELEHPEELGNDPAFERATWCGRRWDEIHADHGQDGVDSYMDHWEDLSARALGSPEVRDRLHALGADPVLYATQTGGTGALARFNPRRAAAWPGRRAVPGRLGVLRRAGLTERPTRPVITGGSGLGRRRVGCHDGPMEISPCAVR